MDVALHFVASDPPTGYAYLLRAGDEHQPGETDDRPFLGWLGLLAVLEESLAQRAD